MTTLTYTKMWASNVNADWSTFRWPGVAQTHMMEIESNMSETPDASISDSSPAGGATSNPLRAATLHDVAHLARVSFVTVSRVINHPEKVSEDTARRVRAAIKKTGYVPNLLAGGLAKQRSHLVIAVIPTFAHRAFINTVTKLGEALETAGYQLLVCQSGYAGDNEAALIESILMRRPDGIVLTTPVRNKAVRTQLQQRRIPVVETWQLHDDPIDAQVGFDHVEVGRAMGGHMVAKGYRSIGMIWSDDARAQLRRKGCVAALAEAGVKVARTELVPAPASMRQGRQVMGLLLDGRKKLDAVICSIDLLAQGALIEAQHRGLRVPSDLGIMGFGDFDFAADLEPPLSTVRIDAGQIGLHAAALLLDRFNVVETGEATGRKVEIGFEVIARESA
jgi:LacI family transcriptional regulator, gluconate utilization system Gnt-I transcriptional repressor